MLNLNDYNLEVDKFLIKSHCSKLKTYWGKQLHDVNIKEICLSLKMDYVLHLDDLIILQIDPVQQYLFRFNKLKDFKNNLNIFQRIYTIISKICTIPVEDLMYTTDPSILKIIEKYIKLKYHLPYVLKQYLESFSKKDFVTCHYLKIIS